MKQSSNAFVAYYYNCSRGEEYGRTDDWLRAFGAIADRIISGINPGTVLDAGCALGLLVESLRRRGFEVSEYAIKNIHPEFRCVGYTPGR